MAEVILDGVNKFYGLFHALQNVSLRIEDGTFVVFVGPSGCGKSTLLRSIAGLEDINEGTIHIGDLDVTKTAPSDRGVAMVFQSYALYPHMTVRENMEFGMKINNVEKAERMKHVDEAARILQLEKLLDRKPGQLSGGQRQRVAIGRAIVKNPNVFLFDEPLSNLDAKLRIQMRVELEALHKQLGATMIYVTHDQVEAMTMADVIVVLNNGIVEQVGPPMELYHKPATEFVAGFIGSPSINFIETNKIQNADIKLNPNANKIGIRPEHLVIVQKGEGDFNARVTVKEQLGGESYLYAKTESDIRLVLKTSGDDMTSVGDSIGISLPVERIYQFDTAGKTLNL